MINDICVSAPRGESDGWTVEIISNAYGETKLIGNYPNEHEAIEKAYDLMNENPKLSFDEKNHRALMEEEMNREHDEIQSEVVLDDQITLLIAEINQEYAIADKAKLREHLYTYPQDYPDCSIEDIRGFVYEHIDEYRQPETSVGENFGLKEAVDQLDEMNNKPSGPKIG